MLLTLPSALRDDNATTNATIIIMLGYLAPSVQKADYTAKVSTYLGNGLLAACLWNCEEALAYDVSAFYPTRQDAAPFVAYMGTAQKTLRSP